MAAITSAIVGLGTAAYGAYQQKKSTSKANAQIAQANKAQKKIAQANKEASEASVRAEKLREKQMELEGIRRRRDVIRQAQGARALGIARANAANAIGSSSVQAGQQQTASRERVDILANLQNIMLGRGIFEENRNIYAAQAKGAQLQGQVNQYTSAAQGYTNQASMYQQVFGAGLSIASNAQTIGNVVSTTFQGARDIFAPNPWSPTVTPFK